MRLLIKNGYTVDPLNNLDGNYDILIENGVIKDVDANIQTEVDKVVDAAGKVVLPGLIDMHTHLREPGHEEKETIKTGCEAAAAGGFTAVACMPNTEPVADNPATVEYIKARAAEAVVKVYPIGSISKKSEGKELAEIGYLKNAGVKALSDDGKPVMNGEIMRRAMEYAGSFDLPIIDHCEDLNLRGTGVMNEGYYSTILGLKPIPAAAEEIMIARDIYLAEMTGAAVHIAHLSTERGLEMIEQARSRGVRITCEVTPHHLFLTDEDVKGYNPNTKVNPPLRSEKDVKALRKGLAAGKIDAIASDHAPHTYEDKLGEFDYAAEGISGLETELALVYDRLINENIIGWNELIKYLLVNPARILDLKAEGLRSGSEADIIVFDPEKEWQVKAENFKSKGRNTPFDGEVLTGKNILTVVGGKIVYDDRSDQGEILY